MYGFCPVFRLVWWSTMPFLHWYGFSPVSHLLSWQAYFTQYGLSPVFRFSFDDKLWHVYTDMASLLCSALVLMTNLLWHLDADMVHFLCSFGKEYEAEATKYSIEFLFVSIYSTQIHSIDNKYLQLNCNWRMSIV